MNYTIRIANKDDINDIITVRQKSWLFAYRNIFSQDEINNLFEEKRNNKEYLDYVDKSIDEGKWLVCEIENKIVAVMSLCFLSETENYAKISSIYCLPNCLRLGIGSKLFNVAKKMFKENGINKFIVWALKDNVIGNAFYLKKGGKLIDRSTKIVCGKEKEIVAYLFKI